MVNQKGYSIIELTIVVGLLSILSITISAIVLTTITNSSRIKHQVRVRQTGDYAMSQLTTLIRNSRSLESCDSAANSFSLRSVDGRLTSIELTGTQISSSSALTVYLTPEDIETSNFDIECNPSDTDPQLINISFSLQRENGDQGKTIENPQNTFTSSTAVRN